MQVSTRKVFVRLKQGKKRSKVSPSAEHARKGRDAKMTKTKIREIFEREIIGYIAESMRDGDYQYAQSEHIKLAHAAALLGVNLHGFDALWVQAKREKAASVGLVAFG